MTLVNIPPQKSPEPKDEWRLFAVNGNQAQQINVEMVADMGQVVAIANSELREGQSIIVTSGDGLADNAAVQVVSSQQPVASSSMNYNHA